MLDANGSRYHVLLGRSDWAAMGDAEGARFGPQWAADLDTELIVDETDQALSLRPLVWSAVAAQERTFTADDLRGADADRYGNRYWIDDSRRRIRVQARALPQGASYWDGAGAAAGAQATGASPAGFTPQPPVVTPAIGELAGLCVSETHQLLIGCADGGGLLRFDLHAIGGPQRHPWPRALAVAPFALARRRGGGCWVLERGERRLWQLDAELRICRRLESPAAPPATFAAVDGSLSMPSPSAPASADDAWMLAAEDPVAIAELADGSVLVLDQGGAAPRLWRYRASVQLGDPVVLSVASILAEGEAFSLRAQAMTVVDGRGDDGAQRLLLSVGDRPQAFAFALRIAGDQLQLVALADFLPLHHYRGGGLLNSCGRAWYHRGDRWAPLVPQQRPRFRRRGVLQSPISEQPEAALGVFDGREHDCVWHRCVIDACLPTETTLQLWTRAANSPEALAHATWRAEPRPYRRAEGAELPFAVAPPAPHGSYETLLQLARGRYLQLRLELNGNGRASPRVFALRLWYPRFSYAQRYLPAAYRSDPDSASLLDRFLANVEGLFTGIEDEIAQVQTLFDPQAVPPGFLDWLGGWLGVLLDPAWDDYRRRLFLRHAMQFFGARGTVRGLLMAMRLAFDDEVDERLFSDPTCGTGIRIIEGWRRRQLPPVAIGDPTTPGPQAMPPSSRWRPSQGGAELARRYTAWLGSSAPRSYPIQAPAAAEEAAWRSFSLANLGFIPAITSIDAKLWQDYHSRRYRDMAAWRASRGLVPDATARFDQIVLPTALPADGAALADWHRFESLVLATRRHAHRFSVLLPLQAAEDALASRVQGRRALAERILALEKPAHTVGDVRFYWDLLRVGEARLGLDTVIDLGTRSPRLTPPLVLGEQNLGAAVLRARHPFDLTDRFVVGRDRLRAVRPPSGFVPQESPA